MKPVLVVGGGISGLACAYELAKAGRPFTLVEASSRLGGKILSERAGDVIYEGGPDSFVTTKPHALELVRELGLEDGLLSTNQTRKNVSVYSRGRLRRYPGGMMMMAPTALFPFLASDVVSWGAKLRILAEPFVPRGAPPEDESIAAFTRRRFGAEAVGSIAGPVMAGIFAGDPEKLSLASTFPQFTEMERSRGSVLLASLEAHRRRKKAPSDAKLTMFMTLSGGVSELVSAVARRLPADSVRLEAPLVGLRRAGEGWRADLREGALEASSVVLAVGADVSGRITREVDRDLSRLLSEIPFSSTATVSLLFEARGFPLPLDGFGFVVDRRERSSILAATFTSTKFPGRLPPDKVLIRCFIGGAGREEALAGSDADLVGRVRGDLGVVLGLDREPLDARVYRWPGANPQYNVGHGARLERIEAALRGHPGLVLAGSSYRGVGIPDCVRSGREAARRILSGPGEGFIA